MTYKVCIPTAGTGSRLGSLTRYLNKSLVGIANRPTICHLIEQFPLSVSFVIALGHKGHLVKEFLELVYPERHFDYAQVEPYEGAGSGLGLSLLACKEYLQEPFIFISCDTLVSGDIPPPKENWMGYAEVEDLNQYRTLEIVSNQVVEISEKGLGKALTHKPYIGLAGVLDYQVFWSKMESGGSQAIETGEVYGLRALLDKKIEAKSFVWHDTGNIHALNRARDFYREINEPNILEKSNEAIWFVGEQVIKFSDDRKFICNRISRAAELEGFVPTITGVGLNMYSYKKVSGKVLSDVVNLPLFENFLDYSSKFWLLTDLDEENRLNFKETCMRFYKDKTYERVDLFYKNFSRKDGREVINGIEMPFLKDLLDAVDWNWLADGLAGKFHGDFHFENILWSEPDKKFTFLDWRQDFGGSLKVGDIYYDLAKLLHGLIVNHEVVANNHYSVDWLDNQILFDIYRKQSLVECERAYVNWLALNNYDIKKVYVLTALIYLNIAALHHHPYSLLLYGLGKSMLNNQLGDKFAKK